MALTYLDYLRIPQLLDQQRLKSDPAEHDEMLFIIIHQTYELWFKQLLHETDLLQRELEAGSTWGAVRTLRRMLTIWKTLVGQIDILETMTPVQFLSFRGFLDNSSGFQSTQFRDIETVLGIRGDAERTVWTSFLSYLERRGHALEAGREEDGLIEVMRAAAEESVVCELLVDLDEGLQEWRYRHVKMVERTIGTKKGTGGSDGVEYLKRTLFRPVFPLLWGIRSQL